ncbi:MAG: hypothetical protein NTX57_18765 [Armatimonadetes bacterium]|nr:hypothetical protein [Armatimonadota bacterium]
MSSSLAIEYGEIAEAQIEDTYLFLQRQVSFEYAERWLAGLQKSVQDEAMLRSSLPGWYNIAPESSDFGERIIYVIRYRIGNGWQILYELADEDGDGQEDTLLVLKVRSAVMNTQPEDEESAT